MNFLDFENHAIKNRQEATYAHDEHKAQALVSHASVYGDIYDVWLLEDLYYEPSLFDTAVEETDETAPSIILHEKYDIACWLCAQISKSPNGEKMLSEAINEGWSLALEDLGGPDFHLDVPQKLIILDRGDMLISALGRSEYFRHMMSVSFVRALRDVWQEKRHGGFTEAYDPENILMLERLRSADLDVLSVLVAWELRTEGSAGLWRHMIGSEDGDIAMRFSGYLERDPSALLNGEALTAAFAQWFRNPARVKACEHEILNDLDRSIEEHQSEGGEGSVFGQRPLKPIKIEMLSCLPDRTAYLQGRGQAILADPFYAGMADMVNQTHLMQVLYDMKVTWVQDVPFRDASLAEKIFPDGQFTALTEEL